MGMKYIVLAVTALAPAVLAQSGAYGQCGGTGWSGSTSCVSGYTCTYSNPYYSQCLPGTGSGSGSGSSSSSATPTTSVAATTTSGGGGGTTAAASGNPFSGVALYANPYYASEISASAIPSLTGAMVRI